MPGQAYENSTRHTPQTDVWAYGMTVYVCLLNPTMGSKSNLDLSFKELLTLQRPYTGLLDIQVISAIIMHQLPSFPPLVSLNLLPQKINVLKDICLA